MFADFTFTNRSPAKKTAKDFKSNAKIKSTYLERALISGIVTSVDAFVYDPIGNPITND
jgi:hypothetical protein